jgi:hypothetical protein
MTCRRPVVGLFFLVLSVGSAARADALLIRDATGSVRFGGTARHGGVVRELSELPLAQRVLAWRSPSHPTLIGTEADWWAIAQCESSGRWDLNVGLFWGGLQFLPSTWFAYGGGPFDDVGQPFPYSPAEQIFVAERVLAGQGSSAWPRCFRWAA